MWAEPLRNLQLLLCPLRHEVSQQGVAVAVDSQHRGGSLADSELDRARQLGLYVGDDLMVQMARSGQSSGCFPDPAEPSGLCYSHRPPSTLLSDPAIGIQLISVFDLEIELGLRRRRKGVVAHL